MFIKIVSDNAKEAIYQCERVCVQQMKNVPSEGESRSVFLEMEGAVTSGSNITREVIKGHEEVYILNDIGQIVETYRWPFTVNHVANARNGQAAEIPRRSRIDLLTPAELAIRNAQLAVEEAGADVLLTEAVTLLGHARDKVADYVDRPRARE